MLYVCMYIYAQYVHAFPILGSAWVDLALQVRPHQYPAKGKNHLPQLTGNTLPNAAQEAVGLLCGKGIMLACVQIGAITPMFFSAKLLSSQ